MWTRSICTETGCVARTTSRSRPDRAPVFPLPGGCDCLQAEHVKPV
jgi:hypothetical protein